MINDSKCLCAKSYKLLVTTFVMLLLVLAVNLLLTKQVWEYKSKWIDLQSRVEKLESFYSQPASETTKQKQ